MEQVTNKCVNGHTGETETGLYKVTVGQSRTSAVVTLLSQNPDSTQL